MDRSVRTGRLSVTISNLFDVFTLVSLIPILTYALRWDSSPSVFSSPYQSVSLSSYGADWGSSSSGEGDRVWRKVAMFLRASRVEMVVRNAQFIRAWWKGVTRGKGGVGENKTQR